MNDNFIVSPKDDVLPGIGVGRLLLGADIEKDILRHVQLYKQKNTKQYWFSLHDDMFIVKLEENYSYKIVSVEVGRGYTGKLLNKIHIGNLISNLVDEDGWVYSDIDGGYVHENIKNTVLGISLDDPLPSDIRSLPDTEEVHCIFIY